MVKYFAFFWIALLSVGIHAQTLNADSLLEKASQNFSASCAVIRFKLTTKTLLKEKPQTSKGSLKICKGSKIRLELGDMTLIADGKTLWRCSKKHKQVTIENLAGKDVPADLFRMVKQYRKEFGDISAQTGNGKMKNCWRVHFINPKNGKKLKEIKFWLRKKNLEPVKLYFQDYNGSETTYEITKYSKAGRLSEKTFQFEPDKNTRIFDRRSR